MRAALLFVIACASGCAHSADLIADADADLRYHDYDGALGAYRKVAAKECVDGQPALCCRALIGEGEALLQLQRRESATRALERARSQCPYDLDVRRKLFLAEHPGDPDPTAGAVRVGLVREHVVATLGERSKLVWLGLFLDGELVGRERMAVTPGNHELEAEAFVEVRGAAGARRPVRLRARHPLTVAPGAGVAELAATARLTLGERPDASLPEDRIVFQMEVTPLAPAGEAAAPAPAIPGAPAVVDRVLAQHLGLELRVSGDAPRVPPELLRRGQGWKMKTELCISPHGRVERVRFLEPAPAHDPRVDAAVLEALRRWRYGAYRVNGVLQAFCHALAVDLGG